MSHFVFYIQSKHDGVLGKMVIPLVLRESATSLITSQISKPQQSTSRSNIHINPLDVTPVNNRSCSNYISV